MIAALLRAALVAAPPSPPARRLPQTAVAVFDHELRVRFAAGPALDIGGRAAEEVEGKPLLGHIPQAQREPLLIHYRAALRGEQRSFEYRSATHPAASTGSGSCR